MFALALAAATVFQGSVSEDLHWIEVLRTGGDSPNAHAYFRSRGRAAIPQLEKALINEKGWYAKFGLANILASYGDSSSLPALFKSLCKPPFPSSSGDGIPGALFDLRGFDPKAIAVCESYLKRGSVYERRLAADLLIHIPNRQSSPYPTAETLGARLYASEWKDKVADVKRMRRDPDPVVSHLGLYYRDDVPLEQSDFPREMRLMRSPMDDVREFALDGAIKIGPDRAKELRLKFITDPSYNISWYDCAYPLQSQVSSKDFEKLASILRRAKGEVRAYVINVIGYTRNKSAISLLQPLQHDGNKRVADAAFNAIRRIEGFLR